MWVDIEQNTDAWFDLRLGKATSSHNNDVMAWHDAKNKKTGEPILKWGEPALRYAKLKAFERVTGKRVEGGFSSPDMKRGIEEEPLAIRRYEKETFYKCRPGGFFYNGMTGDSPDSLIGDVGCLEVKCVLQTTHISTMQKGCYDSKYKWQIMGHLLTGELEWVDWVSFCLKMPYDKQIIIHRVRRDEIMISALKSRLVAFELEIQKIVELIK